MISIDEIKALAELSRMKIDEKELQNFANEMDSILDYVGQIKNAVAEDGNKPDPVLKNVMRDDVVLNEDNFYTEDILNNAPKRDSRFLSVKKILN